MQVPSVHDEKVSILVVDDRPENVLALKGILSNPDYDVVTASTGAEALKKVLKHEFALILMDVLMPAMDGFEAATLISGREASRHIPIIFLTAAGTDIGSIYRGYSVGAVDYLVKPIEPDIVRAKVAVFVDLYRKTRRVQRQEAELREIERMRSEEALREREAEYEATFEKAAAGIAHLSTEGEWLRLNQKLCDIIGYSKDEALRMKFQDVAHKDDLPDHIAALRRVLAGEIPSFRSETRLVHKDESIVWVDLTVSLLRESSGQPKKFILVVEDVTKRKRTEDGRRVLARAGEILLGSLDVENTLASTARSVVPYLADWCAIDLVRSPGFKSPRYVVAHTNPTKVQLAHEIRLLYPPDGSDSCGPPHVLLTGRSELYQEITEEILQRLARSPEHLGLLRKLGMKSAMIVPVITRSRKLGTITCVSAESGRRLTPEDLEVAEELACRVALAVDNSRLYQEVVSAVRAREQLLAIVSHDLRNPLSAVSLKATQIGRLAAGVEAGEPIRKNANGILRSVDRMSRLIQSLLDLAKLETGQHLPIEPKSEDAADLIRQAVEMLQPVASAAGLKLESSVQEPPGRLLCDGERMQQVLSNLIGNAIKFTPKGGVITVQARRATEEIVFSVTDTGVGIPEDHISHLFDAYWQETSNRDGVGLGLSIAKGIVEAHGGRIWLESQVGHGSTFYFALPSTGGARRSAAAGSAPGAEARESEATNGV